MTPVKAIVSIVKAFSTLAREVRAEMFRAAFTIDENTRILDLGSENGSNIHRVLHGTRAKPENVFVADIDARAIAEAHRTYGYTPVLIGESGDIPFPDGHFDIVYSSSVIEHVTVDKDQMWTMWSGQAFRREAVRRQQHFAREIERVGKQYFVQTPYKYFPVESHTWLPFFGYLPRWLLIPAIKVANRFWIKRTGPTFYLLTRRDMNALFPGAELLSERKFGLTKSLIAIKGRQPRFG